MLQVNRGGGVGGGGARCLTDLSSSSSSSADHRSLVKYTPCAKTDNQTDEDELQQIAVLISSSSSSAAAPADNSLITHHPSFKSRPSSSLLHRGLISATPQEAPIVQQATTSAALATCNGPLTSSAVPDEAPPTDRSQLISAGRRRSSTSGGSAVTGFLTHLKASRGGDTRVAHVTSTTSLKKSGVGGGGGAEVGESLFEAKTRQNKTCESVFRAAAAVTVAGTSRGGKGGGSGGREEMAYFNKGHTIEPLTPKQVRRQRRKEIARNFGKKRPTDSGLETSTASSDKDGCKWTLVFDPSGRFAYWWSFVVSIAFLYNFWVIIYRFEFGDIEANNMAVWFTLDYTADLLYALDIAFHFRTGFLDDGVLMTESTKLRIHYMNSTVFYVDCLCLLPLDFLYLSIGFNSMLRCFRLVKIYRFWAFLDRTERHTNYPNVVRTVTLLHYLFAIFHWNACLMSIVTKSLPTETHWSLQTTTTEAERDAAATGNNRSLSSDVFARYLHSLYQSTLILTTIGSLPEPQSKAGYVFIIVQFVFGLLLFATILGHVANIVTSISAARKEFQAKLDSVKTYMMLRRVPLRLQDRVIKWFDYLWMTKKSSDEEKTLSLLPNKLKAEIALHVHLDTLKRVEIFQNTEAGFLCELVLRLRPVLFSPGDYICRKGEVGKEMYIVNRGRLQVVNDNGKTVLATLRPGSYFGEISILNMGNAGNRRTASVRSVGYSDLFCLSKNDLWEVLKDYPTARVRLEAIAVKRLERYKKTPIEQETNKGMPRSKSTPGLLESSGKVSLEAMRIANRSILCSSSSHPTPPPSAGSPQLLSGSRGELYSSNGHDGEGGADPMTPPSVTFDRALLTPSASSIDASRDQLSLRHIHSPGESTHPASDTTSPTSSATTPPPPPLSVHPSTAASTASAADAAALAASRRLLLLGASPSVAPTAAFRRLEGGGGGGGGSPSSLRPIDAATTLVATGPVLAAPTPVYSYSSETPFNAESLAIGDDRWLSPLRMLTDPTRGTSAAAASFSSAFPGGSPMTGDPVSVGQSTVALYASSSSAPVCLTSAPFSLSSSCFPVAGAVGGKAGGRLMASPLSTTTTGYLSQADQVVPHPLQHHLHHHQQPQPQQQLLSSSVYIPSSTISAAESNYLPSSLLSSFHGYAQSSFGGPLHYHQQLQQQQPICINHHHRSVTAGSGVYGGASPVAFVQSPDLLLHEISLLRGCLQSLETENATLNLKLNEQQWQLNHRLHDIEMQMRTVSENSLSCSEDNFNVVVNKESVI